MRSILKPSCQLFALLFLLSCASKREAEMMKMYETLQKSDFSYIIPAVFITEKELLERTIQQSFSAERVVVGVSGISGVHGSTTEKEDSECWLQCILVNSLSVSEKNDSLITVMGRDVARVVLDGLANDEAYKKIKITFLRQVQQGSSWIKSNTHKWYAVPSLEIIGT